MFSGRVGGPCSCSWPSPLPERQDLAGAQAQGLKSERPCSLLGRWPPVLTHGVLLPTSNSLQLLLLTPPGCLFHSSLQYLCASMIFFFPFFSPSFFFPQRLLLALPPLFHCLIRIVSIIFFIHLSASHSGPASRHLPYQVIIPLCWWRAARGFREADEK